MVMGTSENTCASALVQFFRLEPITQKSSDLVARIQTTYMRPAFTIRIVEPFYGLHVCGNEGWSH